MSSSGTRDGEIIFRHPHHRRHPSMSDVNSSFRYKRDWRAVVYRVSFVISPCGIEKLLSSPRFLLLRRLNPPGLVSKIIGSISFRWPSGYKFLEWNQSDQSSIRRDRVIYCDFLCSSMLQPRSTNKISEKSLHHRGGHHLHLQRPLSVIATIGQYIQIHIFIYIYDEIVRVKGDAAKPVATTRQDA
jgi:hypothetical protein